MSLPQPLHGTVVARHDLTGWRGALLCGPSGSGKSDLALRLFDMGWRLVADDYAHVWSSGQALYAAPPERIAGKIEARGLGIIGIDHRPVVRLVLRVDCVQHTVERLPEPTFETICGLSLPRLELDIRPASATVTVGHAIDRL